MAQIKFGYCLDEFAPRPDLIPPWVGDRFVPLDDPRCKGTKEEVRRKDVRPSAYGSGTPSISSVQFDPWGVPVKYDGGHVQVETEQGPIKLSRDDTEGWNETFLPSISLLTVAPYMDTRMRVLSDRYYK